MKTLLHNLALTLCCLLPLTSPAQLIYDGADGTNTSIGFGSSAIPGYIADTAISPLWQVGRTTKSYFTSSPLGATGIMTDTLGSYPTNADNFFVLKIPNSLNLIIDFWHRYQTDSTHDGGMVEFSLDHGTTWQNIKGACNADSGISHLPGILTDNFYSPNDTLTTGEQAFTGSSHGTQYCRLQFFTALPVRTTSGGCSFAIDTIYLRFRFVSDANPDTLAGWMIDSVKVEHDIYSGGIVETNTLAQLPISPNPSATGLFTFPVLKNEDELTITISNILGQKLLDTPYRRSIDLSTYPAGMYLYKVSGDDNNYSGRLIYR